VEVIDDLVLVLKLVEFIEGDRDGVVFIEPFAEFAEKCIDGFAFAGCGVAEFDEELG